MKVSKNIRKGSPLFSHLFFSLLAPLSSPCLVLSTRFLPSVCFSHSLLPVPLTPAISSPCALRFPSIFSSSSPVLSLSGLLLLSSRLSFISPLLLGPSSLFSIIPLSLFLSSLPFLGLDLLLFFFPSSSLYLSSSLSAWLSRFLFSSLLPSLAPPLSRLFLSYTIRLWFLFAVSFSSPIIHSPERFSLHPYPNPNHTLLSVRVSTEFTCTYGNTMVMDPSKPDDARWSYTASDIPFRRGDLSSAVINGKVLFVSWFLLAPVVCEECLY